MPARDENGAHETMRLNWWTIAVALFGLACWVGMIALARCYHG